MSLDLTKVKHLADLAQITLKENELQQFTKQLNEILSWVQQLQQVDTDAIDAWDSDPLHETKQRHDDASDTTSRDGVLANAPLEREGFFVVPRIME